MQKKKYIVTLSDEQRTELTAVVNDSSNRANKIRKAQVLLAVDEAPGGQNLTDRVVKELYGGSLSSIGRLRKRFSTNGYQRTVHGLPVTPPRYKKLTEDIELKLIELSRSEPPNGHKHWTLRLLAEKMVEEGHIKAISHESVRQILKKADVVV
jgi:transposase